MAKTRVLVVDDSFLMLQIISDIINSDPELEVIGKAKNGKEALEKAYALKPDVVTLDINLPVMDGLSVLEELMTQQPTRVLMISAYTREGASATLKALELGAVDFIAKPSGEISLDLNTLKDEIISKVKLTARVDLAKFTRATLLAPIEVPKPSLPTVKTLVMIAASTGGPKAILDVMKEIPATLPAAYLIVQHMPIGFTLSFAERLSWQSKIKAKEAEENDLVVAGKAYIAPAGYHMGVEDDGGHLKIRLNQDPLVNFVRPAADVTMLSIAQAVTKNILVVVLTGMGKDGLEGTKKLKAKGAFVIVQDEKTSVVWGMPRVVYEAGLADMMLPVGEIPKAIVEKISM
jgi:two-component system chemotaxis response regulator CheB